MVLDSSVILAILQSEPDHEQFLEQIDSAITCLISAATLVETAIVVFSRRDDGGLEDLRRLLAQLDVAVVPLAASHADLAVDAFRRFGKGQHPDGLNLGDCFSYALAKATGEPLLFKGNNFARTDVARVA